MQVNPTVAAGDFKVSIDGGALANLGTLPAVSPAGSAIVKFTLSTSEMAGANATVICSDAAGSEWCDLTINIPTAARQIDDLAFPATSGRSMVVDASGLVDANTVKVGPTGSGTAQTAGDIPARLPAALTGAGNIKADALAWNGLTTVALPLIPTVAGRTLDVSATGEAGLDWANIGGPTTAQNLSGTSTKAVEPTVAGRTLDVSATGEAGIDWANVGTPGSTVSLSATTVATVTTTTTATTATNLTNAPTNGDFTAVMKTSIGTAVAASAVASVTGNIGGNLLGTLSVTERNAISDAMLDRNMATGTDSGSTTVRTMRQALRFLRNYWEISGGTLTVRKEDDATTSWTGVVTQTAGNPVSKIDPAG